MFGAPMRTPLQMSREPPPKEPVCDNYPWAVRNALTKIHEEVRQIRSEAAQKMKHYYDRNAHLAPFKIGDKVFLYDKVLKKWVKNKLHVPWKGPYTILTIINDCDARIQKDDNHNDIQIVHMDRLASYPSSDDSTGAWLNYTGTADSDEYL